MTAGSRQLLPVPTLKYQASESLLGAVASGEEPAAAAAAKKPEEPTALDTSSAEAVVHSFVSVAAAGELSRLPDLLVADQVEAARKAIEVVGPLVEATLELKQALDQQFPGHAIQITGVDAFAQKLTDLMGQFTVEGVENTSDKEAEGKLTSGAAGAEQKKLSIGAQQTDDGWRIKLPDFQPPADLAPLTESLKDKPEGFRDIAKRVNEKQIADEAAAKAEIDKVLAGTYQPSAPAEKPQEDTAKPEAQPEAQPEPAKKPRERDAVDDTVGPGFLNRG